mmetsp:Transcript_6369/g.18049  ORF Transcript_6369/g.18049 Transcript_6369/m.18049 type:complete len:81 (-) Transcript_6369:1776-2018(-)
MQVTDNFKGVRVAGNEEKPRRGAFEISVQLEDMDEPVLVYSKLKTGKFPNVAKLVDALHKLEETGEVPEVDVEAGGCVVM